MVVSTACRHTYHNACASSALLICMNDVYNSYYTCMYHEEGTRCKHMLLALIKVWYAHVPPQSFSWHHSRGHPHLQCNTWHVHTTDVLVNWWSQKGNATYNICFMSRQQCTCFLSTFTGISSPQCMHASSIWGEFILLLLLSACAVSEITQKNCIYVAVLHWWSFHPASDSSPSGLGEWRLDHCQLY